ncbi:MAG: tetratricopeptide repeat protein, partial [Planctomycetota bacterium]
MDDLTESLKAAFEKDPADTDNFKAYAEHLFFKGLWDTYVDACDRRARILQESLESARLFAKAASIAEDKIDNLARAENLYRAALDSEREFRPALMGLRQVLEKQGKFQDLVDVILEEARLATPVEQPLLFHQAGQILETRVGDIPKAIEVYHRILEMKPGNPKAIDALEKNYRALDRWEDLRELLEGIVASNPAPELQSKVLFKLSKLYETRFADLVRATRCLEMILEIKPGTVSICRDLERLYQEQKNWGALVRILEAQADLDLSSEERARSLQRAGEIMVEKLGDTTAASALFSRAAALMPSLAEAGEEEEEAPVAGKAEEETLRRLTEAVEETDDPSEKLERILVVVRHIVKEAPDFKEAVPWLNQALDVASASPGAWTAVLECAVACQEGERAAECLEKAANETVDDEAAAILLVQLGEFVIDQLGDRAQGIRAYQEALKRHPHDEEAVSRLEVEWEAMGHDEGLTSLYRWQTAKAKDAKTRDLARRKLTRVLSRDPGKADEAVQLLESAVLDDPTRESSLEEYIQMMKGKEKMPELLATLRQAVQEHPEATAARFHLADLLLTLGGHAEAADILESLNQEDPTDAEVVRLLETALEAAEDPDRKAAFLSERIRQIENFEEKLATILELGALYRDKVNNLHKAITAFEDALAIDPANEEALDAMEHIFMESERWSDLADVLERRAAFALDNEATSTLYLRMGEIWGEKAGDLVAAASSLEKASALDPENVAIMAKLEETYTGLRDTENLLRILLRIREATSDPEEAVRCLAKAGELCETKKGDLEQAKKFYREVLDVRPDHVPALKGMQRTLEALGDEAARAETILREAAVTESSSARARLYREGGLLLLPHDPLAAEKALREALALDPENQEIIGSLEEVYASQNEWGRFVEMGLLRLNTLEPGPEHDAQAKQVAKVLEELGRHEEALALFSTTLKNAPQDREALAGVRRIAEVTQSHQEAAEALRREIQLAQPQDVSPLYHRLGEVLEKGLNDLKGALKAFIAAAENHPEKPAITPEIERLMVKLGREKELADRLDSLAERQEGLEKAATLARIGELARRRFFDTDRAILSYSAALELDPGRAGALSALKDLLIHARRWTELVPLLQQEAEQKPEEERGEVQLQLALLCERFTGDLDLAASTFQEILAAEPHNRLALSGLARVQKRAGDHAGLAETWASEFELTEDANSAAALAVQVGTLYEGPLSDLEMAIAWHERALTLVPHLPAALSALERLYERTGNWTGLVKVEEAILRTEASDTRKKAVSVRLGRLYEEKFKNLEMALRCFKSALAFDPECLGALRGVQRVARAAKNFDACRKAFEKEIQMGGEPARLALLHQGVGILLTKEGKHAKALPHFQQASQLAPGNREILRDLIQLYEKEEKPAELAEALERWAALAPTGVERAETLLTVARVYDESLKDSNRALERLQQAQEADPRNTEVLQLLGNLLYARGDHQGVVELLQKEIELAPDREKKSRLLLRAAQVYEDPIGDAFRAAECLQEAVRLNPQGGKGLKALKDLRSRLGPKI